MNRAADKVFRALLSEHGYFTNLPTTVDCAEKERLGYKCESCRKGDWYLCDLCQRQVPWCFGGSDKYLGYCDDCHSKIMETLN